MPDDRPCPVLVLGLGNEFRRDDGVGIMVARELLSRGTSPWIEVREQPGAPTALLHAWRGRDAAVLVDAMSSGAPAGTVRRLDARGEPLLEKLRGSSSTHAVSLTEAIELARALGMLPRELVVYAVEGRVFDPGTLLSEAVRVAVPRAADSVLAEAWRLRRDLEAVPR